MRVAGARASEGARRLYRRSHPRPLDRRSHQYDHPEAVRGGIPTCVWKVRGNRQGAAAFQAFSTPSGSPPKSNVVRVAWAGSCTRIGTWRNDIAGTLKLTTTWTIEAGGAAHEAGGGSVSGTATLTGHVLKIVWASPDQVTTGTYEWTLGRNCRSGQGTLTITAPADRAGESHPTKVTKI